ncbi:hypothetical protein AVEN_207885-1 [Araneus ventricosus]|uniref:Uncharacterized protein n=1 Tax=Araneus ventricosus TaxID=182803 RepID=A0A4Y2R2A8_ARAVE|nr:hypothetical protein AVEN_207885-1 [Araneus ventricosus]
MEEKVNHSLFSSHSDCLSIHPGELKMRQSCQRYGNIFRRVTRILGKIASDVHSNRLVLDRHRQQTIHIADFLSRIFKMRLLRVLSLQVEPPFLMNENVKNYEARRKSDSSFPFQFPL